MMNTQRGQQRKRNSRQREPREREFDQQIIDISRVTRVVAGGKRMRFRACIVLGDKNGKVGYAVAKGADVALAVGKAANAAKKTMISVPIKDGTIPHEVHLKLGASRILMKPAPSGTGVIAGGALRSLFEVAGIHNIVSKTQGSRNKVNNVKAAFAAFQSFRKQ